MFGLFETAIGNALTVSEKLLMMETPTKREIAQLADAGLTIAAIASIVGYSEDIVSQVLERECG